MNILVACLLLVVVTVVWGQNDTEPAPLSLERTCEIPKGATLSPVTLFTANTTDLVKPTRSNMRLAARAFRSPKNLIREGRQATAMNTSNWAAEKKPWNDLCPEKVTYIQPKKWFVFGGQICLTPLPWRNFRYPTIQCIYKACQFVKRPLFFCRPDVPKTYFIPIYCADPAVGKFKKRLYPIYTYRYCTCCRYGCPRLDTLVVAEV
ncbi:uncharacterized protein LOC110457713 [Mizuhopecten yessoensis]|uniref:uncharacterized protein LOC110457713 n=1 Tax=Mizuhopecten yessoensis TaxID=6573 RepID=UPI000B45A912|nr:uncharacterized protein LOC110457713 [Mizuhopecten yessoensis]